MNNITLVSRGFLITCILNGIIFECCSLMKLLWKWCGLNIVYLILYADKFMVYM